jgi:hypothetical protein
VSEALATRLITVAATLGGVVLTLVGSALRSDTPNCGFVHTGRAKICTKPQLGVCERGTRYV